jgi:hypothetical protein
MNWTRSSMLYHNLLNNLFVSECWRWGYRRQWFRMCDMHVWCKRHFDFALPTPLPVQLLCWFSSLPGWICEFALYQFISNTLSVVRLEQICKYLITERGGHKVNEICGHFLSSVCHSLTVVNVTAILYYNVYICDSFSCSHNESCKNTPINTACLSVCVHVAAWELLNGFSFNPILGSFIKICSNIPHFF